MDLIMIMMTQRAFAVFDCYVQPYVPNKSSYSIDTTIFCQESEWNTILPVHIIFILFQSVSPFVYKQMITRKSNELDFENWSVVQTSLFLDKRDDVPYFELLVMINKVSASILMAFLGSFPALQLSLLIIISFFMICTIANFLPYKYQELNMVAIQMNLSDVIICALLAIFVNNKDQGVLTFVSVLILITLITAFLQWIQMFYKCVIWFINIKDESKCNQMAYIKKSKETKFMREDAIASNCMRFNNMSYQDCIEKLKFAAESDIILMVKALDVLNRYISGKEDTILGKYNNKLWQSKTLNRMKFSSGLHSDEDMENIKVENMENIKVEDMENIKVEILAQIDPQQEAVLPTEKIVKTNDSTNKIEDISIIN